MVIAVLGVNNRMPNPVRAGDVLDFEAEIVAKRESKSRPGTGVVTTRGRLTNQRGEIVFDSETVTLVHRRPASGEGQRGRLTRSSVAALYTGSSGRWTPVGTTTRTGSPGRTSPPSTTTPITPPRRTSAPSASRASTAAMSPSWTPSS